MGVLQQLLACVLIVSCAGLCQEAPLRRGPPVGPYKLGKVTTSNALDRQLIQRCKVHFRNTTLDHFSWVRYCRLMSLYKCPAIVQYASQFTQQNIGII